LAFGEGAGELVVARPGAFVAEVRGVVGVDELVFLRLGIGLVVRVHRLARLHAFRRGRRRGIRRD
jgi:hypothetical protein